jgi:hypothetical protein
MDCIPLGEARRADIGDAPEVIRLRQAMFEAMASAGAAALAAANKDWHRAGIRERERQLAEGRSAAYVVDASQPDGPRPASPLGQLIACAVSSLDQRLPGPGFPTGLQAQADAKDLITWDINVDSTIVRAHQHAAGARKGGTCRRSRPAASPPSRPTTTLGARAAA